ncbi:ATP-binding protein [Methanoculleus sp. 10]|uniref:ATP-binding protein n=1 Tax=Methanoculleus sp. 10 TaxID=430615 RepID=UPI0025D93F13|nr:ATP-binding protein [Methanoculleus sp. 10]
MNELDEHPRIEAKTAREVSASLMETICAYANEPGLSGGFLLLGIHECEEPRDRKYCIVGIDNPDKIQRDVAEQCASRFNRVIRPECFVETVEGKAVVGIFVPEAQAGDKPIFFKKVGLPKGAFRRIGSTNQQCTDDDLQEMYQEGRIRPYDETIVADATLDDLDGDAIAEYRRVRIGVDPDAEELRWSDAELLESLHCVKMRENTLRPTIAGLILFGSKKALRKFFPMMRLDYLRVPGRNWVEDPDHPFEAIEMREPLFHLLSRGLAAIMDDIPRAFAFTSDDGLMRQEEPRIPPRVIREALVNALMHRSYLIHSPVQVIRYANRLEIRNPGHSLKPVESLGEPGSKPRNPTIAGVLHEMKFAESKGSGIRVMRQLMRSARLSPPTFESEREQDLFTATFLMHHFLDQQDLQWLEHFKDANLSADEARILIHAREIGSVNNAICRDYTGLDTLAASGMLRRLRDLGLLVQHPHASATYYTPTRRLLHPGEEEKMVEGGGTIGRGHPVPDGLPTMPDGLPTMPDGLPTMPDGLPTMPDGLPTMPDGLPTMPDGLPTMPDGLPTMPDGLPTMPDGLPTMPDGLPAYLPTKLAGAIRNLGQRSPPGQVQQVVIELCSIRAYTADELAVLLRRNKKWVFRSYLSPLLRAGILEYTIPENPRHPTQAYRTKK